MTHKAPLVMVHRCGSLNGISKNGTSIEEPQPAVRVIIDACQQWPVETVVSGREVTEECVPGREPTREQDRLIRLQGCRRKRICLRKMYHRAQFRIRRRGYSLLTRFDFGHPILPALCSFLNLWQRMVHFCTELVSNSARVAPAVYLQTRA